MDLLIMTQILGKMPVRAAMTMASHFTQEQLAESALSVLTELREHFFLRLPRPDAVQLARAWVQVSLPHGFTSNIAWNHVLALSRMDPSNVAVENTVVPEDTDAEKHITINVTQPARLVIHFVANQQVAAASTAPSAPVVVPTAPVVVAPVTTKTTCNCPSSCCSNGEPNAVAPVAPSVVNESQQLLLQPTAVVGSCAEVSPPMNAQPVAQAASVSVPPPSQPKPWWLP